MVYATAGVLAFTLGTLGSAALSVQRSPLGFADLLQREDVQTELRLTEAQTRLWTKRDPPPKVVVTEAFQPDVLVIEDPKEAKRKNAKREAVVWEVLGPGQTLRLWQLYCQWNGPYVLLRNDYRQSLGFSGDQNQRVSMAEASYDKRLVELRALARGPQGEIGRADPKRVRDALLAAERRLHHELDSILDDRQRESLRDFGGKAFVFAERKF